MDDDQDLFEFSRVYLNFLGFIWNLLEFIGIYWDLLEFSGVYLNLLELFGFSGFINFFEDFWIFF
jgi:hypothetical protein